MCVILFKAHILQSLIQIKHLHTEIMDKYLTLSKGQTAKIAVRFQVQTEKISNLQHEDIIPSEFYTMLTPEITILETEYKTKALNLDGVDIRNILEVIDTWKPPVQTVTEYYE